MGTPTYVSYPRSVWCIPGRNCAHMGWRQGCWRYPDRCCTETVPRTTQRPFFWLKNHISLFIHPSTQNCVDFLYILCKMPLNKKSFFLDFYCTSISYINTCITYISLIVKGSSIHYNKMVRKKELDLPRIYKSTSQQDDLKLNKLVHSQA